MSICQCKVDAKGSIAPGSPASPAEVDNMHPSGRVDAGRIGRSVFEIKNVSLGSRLKGPFLEGNKMVPELASTGSGVFSEFQLTLMTARFDGLESIIGRAQSSCLDAHTSFATNTAAANVYKGNGPTKILMVRLFRPSPDRADGCQKMILIKGWDVTELVKGRVQYHVTQFKIPGGVLNILDLTSIITSKGAMVLCAPRRPHGEKVAKKFTPVTSRCPHSTLLASDHALPCLKNALQPHTTIDTSM
ncbi:hypothetical protein B0H14DRAFT_3576107 [Mycena olivaceomarginata]|nr:hypothetical protein B0H14DRAFT_3576107 [Mycena olivaceomarginata]